MKMNRGITLIALVITIIVLIILAGVSISMLSGENGLINRLQLARQNMQNAAIEEQEYLNSLNPFIDAGTAFVLGSAKPEDVLEGYYFQSDYTGGKVVPGEMKDYSHAYDEGGDGKVYTLHAPSLTGE